MALKRKDRDRIDIDERIDSLLRSAVGRDRLWGELDDECRQSSLVALLESVAGIDGDIIECGVFRGASIRRIARAIRDGRADRTIYACDSFEGFPEDGIGREDTTLFRPASLLKGKFTVAGDVPARLEHFFSAFGVQGRIVKGYFADTLPALADRNFAFVHIDCDTYRGHLECLSLLYDRVVPGGIVVFDDYRGPKWPGATRAVDEFFADRPEKPQLSRDRARPAWFVRKPG